MLELLVTSHVAARQQDTDGAIGCSYRESDLPAYLLDYGHLGDFKAVRSGPGFDPAKWTAIYLAWRKEVERSNETEVGRMLAFCQQDLEGYWRYRHFQLLPAPAEWPRPTEAIGLYPVILEFERPRSEWDFASRFWSSTRGEETRLLLNFLLPRGLSTQRGHFRAWVIDDQSSAGSRVVSRYLQRGYSPGLGMDETGCFSDTGGLEELPKTPEEGPAPISLQDGARVPESAPGLVDDYYALPKSVRLSVLRALAWLDRRPHLYPGSRSAAMVANFFALEALLDIDPMGRSQTRGAKARLKDLVARTIPRLRNSGELVDHLYRLRSAIAHGETVLWEDEPATSWKLTPRVSAELSTGQLVDSLVAEVLRRSISGTPSDLANLPGSTWAISLTVPPTNL